MTLLTDQVLAWRGRTACYTAPEPVDRSAIRYFVQATEGSEDRWLGTTERPVEKAVAPPTLVCETNQFYRQAPDGHGYTGHTWDLPLPPSRMLRAGNEYTFHRPLREGDTVTVRWVLADLQERSGSDGRPMLLVVSDVEYSNQHGEAVASNRETVVYQPIGDIDA